MRHITRSMTIAAVVAASTLGAPAAQAAPQASTPVGYLAVGDSYADGWGVAADASYPQLLDAARYASIDTTDTALTGATTFDVAGTQIRTGNSIVTLTVSANDLDWTQLLSGQGDPATLAPVRLAALAGQTVPPTVTAPDGAPIVPIAALIAGIKGANPGATILVTGYPHLFGAVAPDAYCDAGGVPVPGVQAAQANGLVDQLNAVIAGSVAASVAAGANATYVDAVPAFSGHGLCDTAEPWLFDLDDPSTVGVGAAAFHPNARGQKAYAQAVQDAGFRGAALTASRS